MVKWRGRERERGREWRRQKVIKQEKQPESNQRQKTAESPLQVPNTRVSQRVKLKKPWKQPNQLNCRLLATYPTRARVQHKNRRPGQVRIRRASPTPWRSRVAAYHSTNFFSTSATRTVGRGWGCPIPVPEWNRNLLRGSHADSAVMSVGVICRLRRR